MLTTMEEEVDELWTSSVTRIPSTSPATGLDRTKVSWKMLPAALPGRIQQTERQFEPHLRLDILSLFRFQVFPFCTWGEG